MIKNIISQGIGFGTNIKYLLTEGFDNGSITSNILLNHYISNINISLKDSNKFINLIYNQESKRIPITFGEHSLVEQIALSHFTKNIPINIIQQSGYIHWCYFDKYISSDENINDSFIKYDYVNDVFLKSDTITGSYIPLILGEDFYISSIPEKKDSYISICKINDSYISLRESLLDSYTTSKDNLNNMITIIA